jgi:hypothetical protein
LPGEITVNGANTVFTVGTAGTYLIAYSVNFTASTTVGARVTRNGAPIAASVLNSGAAVTSLNNQSVTALAAGDALSLQLFNMTGNAPLTAGSGATLTIVRIA